jgi:hypothetical protein
VQVIKASSVKEKPSWRRGQLTYVKSRVSPRLATRRKFHLRGSTSEAEACHDRRKFGRNVESWCETCECACVLSSGELICKECNETQKDESESTQKDDNLCSNAKSFSK